MYCDGGAGVFHVPRLGGGGALEPCIFIEANAELSPDNGDCGGRAGGGGGLGFSARGGGDAVVDDKRFCASACPAIESRSAARSDTKLRTLRLRASVSSVSSR